MKKTNKLLWTPIFAIGMLLMGLSTSWLALVPVYTGAVFMLVVAAGTLLGATGALIGAAFYCGGVCALGLLLGIEIWPIALWLFALFASVYALVNLQLRKKEALSRVMINTGIAVFAYIALSYMLVNMAFGDVLVWLSGQLEEGLQTWRDLQPESLSYMLSNLSINKTLPDMGYTEISFQLSDADLTLLSANLVRIFEQSLRLSLINVFVMHALQISVQSSFVPLMLRARKGQVEEYTKLPDLSLVRIPTKINTTLVLLIAVLWIIRLFTVSIYPIFIACWSAIEFIYALQGLSVCEWFLKKRGWSKTARYFVMVIAFVILPTVLFFIGFLEQMLYFRNIGRPTPKDFGLKNPEDDDDMYK